MTYAQEEKTLSDAHSAVTGARRVCRQPGDRAVECAQKKSSTGAKAMKKERRKKHKLESQQKADAELRQMAERKARAEQKAAEELQNKIAAYVPPPPPVEEPASTRQEDYPFASLEDVRSLLLSMPTDRGTAASRRTLGELAQIFLRSDTDMLVHLMRIRSKVLSCGDDEVARRKLVQEFDRALQLYTFVAARLLTSELTPPAERYRVAARLQAKSTMISHMMFEVGSCGFNQDASQDPI